MTGVAIIFYLNQDAPQPRERDYSYVASFMTFSVWIGLGIYAFINFITDSLLEKSIKHKSSYFMIVLFVLCLCSLLLWCCVPARKSACTQSGARASGKPKSRLRSVVVPS